MRTLLVTVDALRSDHLGQFGYHRETMPVLDRLETGAGTRYEATFANGTYTAISLPSMLTSRYLGQDAVRDGPTVASALQSAGVHTAAFHSNAMLAGAVGEVAGFDRFEDFAIDEESDGRGDTRTQRVYNEVIDVLRPIVERLGVREYAERIQERMFPASMIHNPSVYTDAHRTTETVLDHLDSLDDDWFCWVHYMDPHRPYGIGPESPAFADPMDPDAIHALMAKAGIHPESLTDAERQQLIDLYDSDLRYTSEAVGALFDGLLERELWEDVAVILTADHGEEFGEHGQYFHRNHPYDELLRVPLYVKPPTGADRGLADGVLHTVDTTVEMEDRELLDIAPSICEFHQVDVPGAFLGERLANDIPRQVIATGSFRASGTAVAGRWDGWKYIDVDGDEELYNLTEDPGEQDNLADEQASRCHVYRSDIPDYIFDGEAPKLETVAESGAEERLRDLGYLE